MNGVALLTVDHPDRLGALTIAMREELAGHWTAIREDPSVRAVVLTGRGRGFSTGLDLAAAGDGEDPATFNADDAELPAFGLSPIEFDCWLPYIVAVNGVCAGGGFHLVTDADVVLASPEASFLDPHAGVGQVAALEPIALSRRIPLEAVLRMVVLGRTGRMSADDALRCGLVGEVVDSDRLVDRALELAAAAAEGSPATIEASKRAIRAGLQLGLDDALQVGWDAIRAHWSHPDYSEGIAAYQERRAPNWQERTR